MHGVLAAATSFKAPYFDYHALAPEMVLTGVLAVVLLLDLVVDETRKYLVTQVAGLGVLGSLIPTTVGFPGPPYIADAAVSVGMLAYLGLCTLLGLALRAGAANLDRS